MGKGSCGRVAMCALAPEEMQAQVGAKAFINKQGFAAKKHYNVGPGSMVAVLLNAPSRQSWAKDLEEGDDEERYEEGDLIMRTMRWGLVPFYTKAESAKEAGKAGFTMINARSDNVARVHKRLLDTRRCAVMVDGFFEWFDDKNNKKKRPYFIRRKDQKPLLLAGLYDVWRGGADNAETIVSCTVITTDSSSQLGWLHDRMPAMLEGQSLDAWLDTKSVPFTDPRIQEVLRPYSGELELYEVSPTVNSIANNTPDCIMPLSLFKEKQFASGIGAYFGAKTRTADEAVRTASLSQRANDQDTVANNSSVHSSGDDSESKRVHEHRAAEDDEQQCKAENMHECSGGESGKEEESDGVRKRDVDNEGGGREAGGVKGEMDLRHGESLKKERDMKKEGEVERDKHVKKERDSKLDATSKPRKGGKKAMSRPVSKKRGGDASTEDDMDDEKEKKEETKEGKKKRKSEHSKGGRMQKDDKATSKKKDSTTAAEVDGVIDLRYDEEAAAGSSSEVEARSHKKHKSHHKTDKPLEAGQTSILNFLSKKP